MTQLEIPEDIQILLDCLSHRDELAFEEMQPLKDWVENNDGGELVLSKALAQNTQLGSAMADVEVRVPKTLRRKVISYVRRNIEVEGSSKRASIRTPAAAAPIGPQPPWSIKQRITFLAGLTAGIAAIFLAGFLVQYVSSLYGTLDYEQLAVDSIDWVESIDKQNGWKPYQKSMSHPLPYEIVGTPIQMAEFDTGQFGYATAYDLKFPAPVSEPDARGVLFVFKTAKHYEHEAFGRSPDYGSATHQVGISKNGEHAYVLNVRGSTSTYMQLIPKEFRGTPIAYLLRFSWFLC